MWHYLTLDTLLTVADIPRMDGAFGVGGSGGNNPTDYGTQSNLAIFMAMFMICAIEVVLVKIVTAINDDIDDDENNTGGDSFLHFNHDEYRNIQFQGRRSAMSSMWIVNGMNDE